LIDNYFYFEKITISGEFWCPTLVFIFQNLFLVTNVKKNMLGALNDTPFVNKNKIVINSFSLGKNENYEINPPTGPIFFGDPG
jgi:hypothetical protein